MGPPMRDLLPDLTARLARAPGVEYAEARHVRDQSERIRVRDGEVEQASHSESGGLGVRVLVRGAWGFAAAPDGDEAAADACGQAALEAARAAARVSPGHVRLAEEEPQRG